jgi:hypothetical protein
METPTDIAASALCLPTKATNGSNAWQHGLPSCYLICCQACIVALFDQSVPVLCCAADFATLIGKPPHFFTLPYAGYDVDLMAGGLVVACCVLLMFTTAGGSWFNICECPVCFHMFL